MFTDFHSENLTCGNQRYNPRESGKNIFIKINFNKYKMP